MDAGVIMNATQIAARSLGYTSLKDKQTEVITNFLLGNDVFAVLPMGYGKSLCYTSLPKAFDIIFETENYRCYTFNCYNKGSGMYFSFSTHIYICKLTQSSMAKNVEQSSV